MTTTTDLKAVLLASVRRNRAAVLARLDGLSEYDRRRPLTSTGTNLLGLVKHLAGVEYGYFGESFGRPPIERPTWFQDDPYTEIDMWATPDESSDYITGTYRKACAHSDATIADLDLDSPGHVAHWAEGARRRRLARCWSEWSARPRGTPGMRTSSANRSTAESELTHPSARTRRSGATR